MKIGEAHQSQSSSLYSANTIGAPKHPALIGVADRTGKKYYWRTVPGLHCLLAEGDIGAPIYWRTEAPLRQYIGALRPPCANILALRCPPAPIVLVLVLYARHSLQSSELGPPQPLNPQVSVSPPLDPGGGTHLQERWWVGSQYEGTDTVVL
jgi:hypothetical protein